MSDREVVESVAFRQLEQLVRHLGEELAAFRRRALTAEARARVLEAAVELGADSASIERLRALEVENADLKARVAFASDRTRQLLARVHFLRQQQGRPVAPEVPRTAGGRT